MRKYSHLHQTAFNCAKCTLNKDICIIANIQLSFKTLSCHFSHHKPVYKLKNGLKQFLEFSVLCSSSVCPFLLYCILASAMNT